MQQERTFFGLWSVAKSALAGLLVVVLLFAAILAANPFHRQLFHGGTAADSHLCIVCLFASGQVNSADVAPLLAVLVSCFLGLTVLVETVVLSGIDLRLSPSRAPPSVFSSHTVVD